MAYKQDKDACCCEYILPLFALVGCRWSRWWQATNTLKQSKGCLLL